MSRKTQQEKKLSFLKQMQERKHIIFDPFSDDITERDKENEWKTLLKIAENLGLVPPNKKWQYVRDVLWKNLKKSTMTKVRSSKRSSKPLKLTELNYFVLNIIGKNSTPLIDLNEEISMPTDIVPNSPEFVSIDEDSFVSSMVAAQDNGDNENKIRYAYRRYKQKLTLDCLAINRYKLALECFDHEIKYSLPQSKFTRKLLSKRYG